MASEWSDVKFMKVKNLRGRAKEEADKQNLAGDDLVVLRTSIDSLPEYSIEKVEGDPIKFLQRLADSK